MSKRVAIIGMGFAGLSAGLYLAGKKDVKVHIYDRKKEPRSHTTGGVAKMLLDIILSYINFYPVDAVQTYVHSFKLDLGGGMVIRYHSNQVLGYVFNPTKLLKIMAEDIERHDNITMRYEQTWRDEYEEKYNYIIDARGIYPILNKIPKNDVHVGYQVDIPINSEHEDITIVLSDVAPDGYIWDFRAGEYRRVGLGYSLEYANKISVTDALEKTMEILGYDSVNLNPKKIYGGYIPTARTYDNHVNGKYIYVGDRGLFCDPATGGGIGWAMLSGIFAGMAILSGRIDNFNKYVIPIREELWRRYTLKKYILRLPKRVIYYLAKTMMKLIDPSKVNPLELGNLALRNIKTTPEAS